MRTSTCSFDHPSILKDFTLDIWVPSFLWIDAHLMQRKMPNCFELVLCDRRHGG